MKKFSYFFVCFIRKEILDITDNISQCLQRSSLSATKCQEIAGNVVKILHTKRHYESFDKLWDELLQEKEKHKVIEEATLPHRREMYVRYDTPNHHDHNQPEHFCRQHYFNILDFVVVNTRERLSSICQTSKYHN